MAKDTEDKVVVKVALVMDLEGNAESYSATLRLPGLAKIKVGPVEDLDELWPLLTARAGQEIIAATLSQMQASLSEVRGGNVSFE